LTTATKLDLSEECSAFNATSPSQAWGTRRQGSNEPGFSSLDMSAVPSEIIAAGPGAVRFYEKLLSAGQSPRFAEMLTLQQPPAVKGTDRTYMEGRLNNQQLDRMPRHQAENIVQIARRAGISITGKYYASGLADKRGPADPAAWVDSTADIKKVARERNLNVEGAVEHKAIPMPPPPSKPLSERLTREMMRAERKSHPKMKAGELREMVVAKYGRKVKK
jgi:hypothetical protein